MAGRTVLADAQFGVARILRPWDGALSLTGPYQGASVSRQIMLTEVIDPPGGQPLDPFAQARQTGYDPALVKGIEVPVGSRVVLWLPAIQFGGMTPGRYAWSIMWRLRNTYDYRNARIPYHYPKQGEGVADTTPGVAGPRVVIPAAYQSVIYNETPEPGSATARVNPNIRSEDVTTGSSNLGLPFLPGGSEGHIQQGLANPAVNAAAPYPLYQVHEVQAVGDEMLISVYRDNSAGGSWDFATTDQFLAQYLGSNFPDIGVYVLVGSAP